MYPPPNKRVSLQIFFFCIAIKKASFSFWLFEREKQPFLLKMNADSWKRMSTLKQCCSEIEKVWIHMQLGMEISMALSVGWYDYVIGVGRDIVFIRALFFCNREQLFWFSILFFSCVLEQRNNAVFILDIWKCRATIITFTSGIFLLLSFYSSIWCHFFFILGTVAGWVLQQIFFFSFSCVGMALDFLVFQQHNDFWIFKYT